MAPGEIDNSLRAKVEEEYNRQSQFNVNTDFFTFEEFKQIKREMMLEALFLYFYTPIDEKKLYEDLIEIQNTMNGRARSATVDAINNLKHPEDIYFKKREDKK